MKLQDDFSNIEEFETEIKSKGFFEIWEQFQDEGANGFEYNQLREWQEKFKPFGLTFDYGLDADSYDFEIN